MDNVTLVFPTDEGWDSARQAWNLAVDQQPAAVALPESAEEVAQAVRFARERGLRVVPQSTGHTASPLGDLSGALLVKTERLRSVEIDPEARIASADGGALWMDVTYPAGSLPYWATTSVDGRYCLVSLSNANAVSIVDYTTATEVARVPVGSFPQRERLARVAPDVLPTLLPT